MPATALPEEYLGRRDDAVFALVICSTVDDHLRADECRETGRLSFDARSVQAVAGLIACQLARHWRCLL